MPIPVDLRLDARWIVPIEPEGVLEQHTLLVADGRIVALVPTAVAERDYAARERVARIPSFVRGVVMERVEEWARRQGRREVTPELLAEVRGALPIDFSKRKPFFATDDG